MARTRGKASKVPQQQVSLADNVLYLRGRLAHLLDLLDRTACPITSGRYVVAALSDLRPTVRRVRADSH